MAENQPREDMGEPMDTPPSPLDYAHGRYVKPPSSMSVGSQMALGFAFWLFLLVTTSVMVEGGPALPITERYVMVALAGVIVVGVSLWVRMKVKWRGFIPGVLIGFGLTCLVPVGIVAVVCGNWK